MSRLFPLDQGRSCPCQRKASVRRYCYLPGQCSSGHGLDLPDNVLAISADSMDIVGSRNPCRQACRRVGRKLIKTEPARPTGALSRWVHRNYFQIELGAKAKQPIVGAHAWMGSARLKVDAKRASNERAAGIKVRRHDSQVIDSAFHAISSFKRFLRPGFIHSASLALSPRQTERRSSPPGSVTSRDSRNCLFSVHSDGAYKKPNDTLFLRPFTA